MTEPKRDGLKPCPTCGKLASVNRDSSVFQGQNYGDRYPHDVAIQAHGYQVRCLVCGLQTCWWHYESEAIEAWNRRPAEDEGERDVFLKQQARCAMNVVPDLLDAWDEVPNDVKSDPELKRVARHMQKLYEAMDEPTAPADEGEKLNCLERTCPFEDFFGDKEKIAKILALAKGNKTSCGTCNAIWELLDA